MIPVSSSAISHMGYDPIAAQMAICFKQGNTYNFCRVPGYVFDAFLSAPSKGKYYTKYIRGRYQCGRGFGY